MSDETFADFAASFSYGSRSDLTFKFLAGLPEQKAAEGIRRVLEEAGALLDHGDPAPLAALIAELQGVAYGRRGVATRYHYPDAPFTRPARPLAESRVALLSSSGHFAAGDDPEPFGVENMTQGEAERRISDFLKAPPTLSSIPIDIPAAELRVRHGGYDVRGARADHNTAFPIDRLRELLAAGVIGDLLPDAFSFTGAAAQGRIIRDAGPAWAEMLAEREVDVVLLVPV